MASTTYYEDVEEAQKEADRRNTLDDLLYRRWEVRESNKGLGYWLTRVTAVSARDFFRGVPGRGIDY